MYGLVNKAIKGFAIETGGEDAWAEILKNSTCEVDEFISMQAYPDELTLSLVDAAARHFNVAADEILHGFGRHWILFTASEGYSGTLDMYGDNMEEFLNNLDDMHTRLQLTMPELKMPSFRCSYDEDKNLLVDYRSERTGLEAMVLGLLEGIGERFNRSIAITQVDAPVGINARFYVRFVEQKRNAA